MNVAPTRLPMAVFVSGARKFMAVLSDSFLRDEDLENDLDAVLGAPAGPVGVAGTKRRQRRRDGFLRCGLSKPSSGTVAELGRAVTRLDRVLDRLVTIAQVREWEPPYPNVAKVIARAVDVRAQQPCLVGEFDADRAHLRRLAMAADDLLGLLADDDVEVSDDAAA